MRTFLGVDGGGTKTDFLLIDASGRVLASRREGSAYYPQIGVDALWAMIIEGVRATLAQAAVSPAALTFACIGLPAYGEDSALLPRLNAIAAAILPMTHYHCVNDMVCGWAAALAGRDGINAFKRLVEKENLGAVNHGGGHGQFFLHTV